ncbi:MAG: hypothetical protein JGK40_13695 [Microcoleus sp. PH2017_21_RUC_O_A]|nr:MULTISPECIES: hypothetical protein [unclassified Microcoleus]MCC3529108.1 hypothetical protein [Microcoleus sp. PH2017_21_RUC_O_A]
MPKIFDQNKQRQSTRLQHCTRISAVGASAMELNSEIAFLLSLRVRLGLE